MQCPEQTADHRLPTMGMPLTHPHTLILHTQLAPLVFLSLEFHSWNLEFQQNANIFLLNNYIDFLGDLM